MEHEFTISSWGSATCNKCGQIFMFWKEKPISKDYLPDDKCPVTEHVYPGAEIIFIWHVNKQKHRGKVKKVYPTYVTIETTGHSLVVYWKEIVSPI